MLSFDFEVIHTTMNAFIIAALRSPVGKANRGGFRFLRPDDLAAQVIRQLVAQIPNLDVVNASYHCLYDFSS